MKGMERKYDVSIVGGGPAGYFTALRLKELCPGLSIAAESIAKKIKRD